MPRLRTILLLTLLVPSAALAAEAPGGVLGALLAAARDAPAPLYEGTAKSYRDGMMTPDDLKGCLVLAYRIDDTGVAVARMKGDLRLLDGRIAETGPRLKSLAAAGLADPAKRRTYTDGVAAYNALVEQRRDAAAAHNRKVTEYSEMAGRFNAACNGRAFFPSDLAAVTPALPPDVQARLKQGSRLSR